ncbi:uncharacterized protein LOC111014833 isoform X2 [Momordica charantia]|uniref:Uncharacterized protein LOC111014833 isoform X2 n=1 Tax=Momordica charantia TaxID=3673 RepID=A0A6J1CV09_MOMCH|nr:uncharacterized protein LOC111014833 isoform X2 [Momordica charantia]
MLLDDSALVTAMEEAMLKYKIMHGHEIFQISVEGGEAFNGGGESDEPKRGGDEKSNIEANNVNFEVDEITNTSPNNENISVEPCPISCADFSDALHVKETQQGPIEDSNLNLKGAEGYNKLLEQYYELEEKRQKVLDQLYHGGWNYDDVSAGSSVGTQWGTSSAYQEHPVPASQTSHNHAISTCWPSSYPIPVGPQSSSLADGDIIKTAMDAAARAISSMTTKIPEKVSERRDGIMPQSASSETDLAAVFNAWYSAGFYTDTLWSNLMPRNSKSKSYAKRNQNQAFTCLAHVTKISPFLHTPWHLLCYNSKIFFIELCLYSGKPALIQMNFNFAVFFFSFSYWV